MTTYYLTPKIILTDLLREQLSDPRTTRESTHSETFETFASSFTLTPTYENVQTITSVVEGATPLTKWVDYFFDYQNQKVILNHTSTDTVVINYKQGDGWIFPEKPSVKLTEESFPRINLTQIGGVATRFGQVNAPMEDTYAIQVDLWIKDDYVLTVGDLKYEGEKLAEYLAVQAKNALTRHAENLHPYAYSLQIATGIRDLPYDEEYQSHHKIFIVEMNSVFEGEITI